MKREEQPEASLKRLVKGPAPSSLRLGGSSGHGWAPLQARRPLRLTQLRSRRSCAKSLRCAGGLAASVACLTRLQARLLPGQLAGGCTRGRGRRPRPRRLGSVGDWALPITISSLWRSALGWCLATRACSQRLLLGRLGAAWGPLRRNSPAADSALGNSEGESGWGSAVALAKATPQRAPPSCTHWERARGPSL